MDAAPPTPGPAAEHWTDGLVDTPVGPVRRVRTVLSLRDRLGSVLMRWGMGRMSYLVPPGLYAVGHPTAESPVLVSANYKLSFDHLRRALTGRNAWILVLDTDGINVWCAAGKGTFGTDELVKRVRASALDKVVSHRRLVVPQLGAPGVSAHQVRERCGFRVTYGPVRAEDLPAFLDGGMKASEEMRRVRFGVWDRAVLIPVEVVLGAAPALLVATALLLLGGLGRGGFSWTGVRTTGLVAASMVIGTFLYGSVVGPLLLPWLPGRAFSVKGALLGAVLVVALVLPGGPAWVLSGGWWHLAAWTLLLPALASFVVMSFTGATTFTSLSGVNRELRVAVPLQLAGAVVGLGLWLTGLFMGGGTAT